MGRDAAFAGDGGFGSGLSDGREEAVMATKVMWTKVVIPGTGLEHWKLRVSPYVEFWLEGKFDKQWVLSGDNDMWNGVAKVPLDVCQSGMVDVMRWANQYLATQINNHLFRYSTQMLTVVAQLKGEEG